MCLDFYNSFEDFATIYHKLCRKTQLVLVMKSIDIMQIHVQMCFTVQLRWDRTGAYDTWSKAFVLPTRDWSQHHLLHPLNLNFTLTTNWYSTRSKWTLLTKATLSPDTHRVVLGELGDLIPKFLFTGLLWSSFGLTRLRIPFACSLYSVVPLCVTNDSKLANFTLVNQH